MNRIVELSEWKTFDSQNGINFPWYTRTFISELIKWNISEWKVFEYGAGNSTMWWKKNAKIVHSVDTNQFWAEKSGAIFETNKEKFISFPETLIEDELFDCIIIDGEPTEWRDDCTDTAIRCIKNNGILIIDNFEQASVSGLCSWPKTNKLLESYNRQIFKEPSHTDWKTGYWIISKAPNIFEY
jgi:hypothetical protein